MKNLKTAIVVDSGCGIKNNTIKDVYVVPMIVVKVENKQETSFRDGIDITSKEIIDDMLNGIVYKTASPVMGECAELIEKLAKEYDEVYILSMPQPVSGTYNQ
jgi:fatty acid-binding protein DegV